MSLDAADRGLADLLGRLSARGYRFIAPTPETHRRVVARPDKKEAADLRDIFGWSLPFARETLPADLLGPLQTAAMVERSGSLLKSRVRVASLGGRLFLHSAFPTDDHDAVFLGPDSYRFVDFLDSALMGAPVPDRLIDIGAGAGVGAIMAARHLPGARLLLADVNPLALRLARINADHAGVAVETLLGSGLDAVEGPIQLAIANPPFILDSAGRAYRDGGAMHGAELSRDWALAAARRLAPGGRVLLYTGSAIVAGEDGLRTALEAALAALGCTLDYRELDSDIFGEQLSEPGYEDVERIAAVGAVITRQARRHLGSGSG